MTYPEYFASFGGVNPQYLASINHFHRENVECSLKGDMLSVVPTSIFGTVPMGAMKFGPSNRPVTIELAYVQQQRLAERGIGLAPNFYQEEGHLPALLADYLLETALCYVFDESEHDGYLCTKSMPVYDSARHYYPLPAPSKSVCEVLHTTAEEITSGKLKVARITQLGETKWAVAARQCDFRPKAGTVVFPAYAVETHVQVMVRGLANQRFALSFIDKDGMEQSLPTTLNTEVLSRLYGAGYAFQVQGGVRSKTNFGDLILPDLGHNGDLVTINALSVTAVKKLG